MHKKYFKMCYSQKSNLSNDLIQLTWKHKMDGGSWIPTFTVFSLQNVFLLTSYCTTIFQVAKMSNTLESKENLLVLFCPLIFFALKDRKNTRQRIFKHWGVSFEHLDFIIQDRSNNIHLGCCPKWII